MTKCTYSRFRHIQSHAKQCFTLEGPDQAITLIFKSNHSKSKSGGSGLLFCYFLTCLPFNPEFPDRRPRKFARDRISITGDSIRQLTDEASIALRASGGSTFRIHPRLNSRGLLRRRINVADDLFSHREGELAQRLKFYYKVGPVPFLIVGYWSTDNLNDLRFPSNLCVFLGLLMVTDRNGITPQTWLAQMFKDVVARIRGLGLNQSTKMADMANRLDAGAKEQFIAHFESFWFSMKAVTGIIDDRLHAAWRLEALKKVGSGPTATLEASSDVAAYTVSLYDGLYRLIDIIAELEWIRKEDIRKRFPELRFVWLLRNKFLVHPKVRSIDNRLSPGFVLARLKHYPKRRRYG